MTEDDSPAQELTVPHIPAHHFRTIYATGAVVSGPISAPPYLVVTFYVDVMAVEKEEYRLSSADVDTKFTEYRLKDGGLQVAPQREDQVRVLLNEPTARMLINLLQERFPGTKGTAA